MSDLISTIREIVRSELVRGSVIDVDAFCRILGPLCPGLTHQQLENEILKVVCNYGGGASWGQDDNACSTKSSGESGSPEV